MWPNSSKLIIGAIIVLFVLSSGCFGFGDKTNANSQQEPAAALEGPYKYKLSESELGEGWQLVWEAKNMAGLPLEQQRAFASYGITNAAGWQYVRGNESLYVWARDFENKDKLVELEESKILLPLNWKKAKKLAIGDMGYVGMLMVADIATGYRGDPVLTAYVARGDETFFVQYTNFPYEGRSIYDGENQPALERFIVGLARKLLEKT